MLYGISYSHCSRLRSHLNFLIAEIRKAEKVRWHQYVDDVPFLLQSLQRVEAVERELADALKLLKALKALGEAMAAV